MRISDWSSDVCSSDLAPLTDAAENSGADRDDSGGDEERADDQGRGDRRGKGPEERGHAEDQREEAVGEQPPPAGAHRRRVARHRVVHRSSPPCYDANDADHPQVPRGAGGRTRFPESASACIVPAMPHSAFVPLRIFSSYTMLDGAIEPKQIAKRAQEMGFPAAALTDRNGLYAAMAFSDACMASGVQPIIGTMLGVCRPDMPEGVEAPLDWLALYAQDKTGYDNLCALVSRAHLDRPI